MPDVAVLGSWMDAVAIAWFFVHLCSLVRRLTSKQRLVDLPLADIVSKAIEYYCYLVAILLFNNGTPTTEIGKLWWVFMIPDFMLLLFWSCQMCSEYITRVLSAVNWDTVTFSSFMRPLLKRSNSSNPQ
ncbi:hypothetical protein FPQ18DRAFT_334923 [Pyronema domesticum]|nr:hypothetical protein FPQ18DRAFT_334923 [Pyronema domesticum]